MLDDHIKLNDRKYEDVGILWYSAVYSR
jgi:hypothetical protein